MTTVTMKTLALCLEEMIAEDIAAFIWGVPGVGKTAVVEQVAKKLGIGFIDCRLNVREPVDLTGLPVADLTAGVTQWLRPEFLPNVKRDGARGIFFLDELNTVGPSMMPCAFQLVQERKAGTHAIPDGWVPIAAGNRVKDRASAQRMPTPLRNKLAHFTVEPDVDAWVEWAIPAGINPYVIAFLRFRKDLLHVMPESDEVNSFPTPRAWEKVAKVVNRPREVRQHLVSSIVGDGPAAELEGFLRVFSTLPKIEEAIANPTTATLPPQNEPASCYAMAMALARSATRQNLQAIMTYVKRFTTREFEVISVLDAVKRDASLTQTSAYGVWAVANQDVAL
jgi:MoxR-like ATPase